MTTETLDTALLTLDLWGVKMSIQVHRQGDKKQLGKLLSDVLTCEMSKSSTRIAVVTQLLLKLTKDSRYSDSCLVLPGEQANIGHRYEVHADEEDESALLLTICSSPAQKTLRKKIAPAARPERELTQYQLFAKQKRAELKEHLSTEKPQEVMRMIALAWQEHKLAAANAQDTEAEHEVVSGGDRPVKRAKTVKAAAA